MFICIENNRYLINVSNLTVKFSYTCHLYLIYFLYLKKSSACDEAPFTKRDYHNPKKRKSWGAPGDASTVKP